MQIFWHWCRSCFFWHLVCTCGLTLQSALRGNRASATFQGILDLVDRFLLVLSPVSRCAVYSSTLIAIKLIFQLQPFCFATTVDVTGLLSSLLSLLAMNLLLETNKKRRHCTVTIMVHHALALRWLVLVKC